MNDKRKRTIDLILFIYVVQFLLFSFILSIFLTYLGYSVVDMEIIALGFLLTMVILPALTIPIIVIGWIYFINRSEPVNILKASVNKNGTQRLVVTNLKWSYLKSNIIVRIFLASSLVIFSTFIRKYHPMINSIYLLIVIFSFTYIILVTIFFSFIPKCAILSEYCLTFISQNGSRSIDVRNIKGFDKIFLKQKSRIIFKQKGKVKPYYLGSLSKEVQDIIIRKYKLNKLALALNHS